MAVEENGAVNWNVMEVEEGIGRTKGKIGILEETEIPGEIEIEIAVETEIVIAVIVRETGT
jgi:hypothetical protein